MAFRAYLQPCSIEGKTIKFKTETKQDSRTIQNFITRNYRGGAETKTERDGLRVKPYGLKDVRSLIEGLSKDRLTADVVEQNEKKYIVFSCYHVSADTLGTELLGIVNKYVSKSNLRSPIDMGITGDEEPLVYCQTDSAVLADFLAWMKINYLISLSYENLQTVFQKLGQISVFNEKFQDLCPPELQTRTPGSRHDQFERVDSLGDEKLKPQEGAGLASPSSAASTSPVPQDWDEEVELESGSVSRSPSPGFFGPFSSSSSSSSGSPGQERKQAVKGRREDDMDVEDTDSKRGAKRPRSDDSGGDPRSPKRQK